VQRSSGRRVCVLVGVGSVGVAIAVLSDCRGDWGGVGGQGGILGVASVAAMALYQTRLALQQRSSGLSMLQCTHSLSRDQLLLALALLLGEETALLAGVWHGEAPPAMKVPLSPQLHPTLPVSVGPWACAAAATMLMMHVCALYPMQSRVRRLIEQVRPTRRRAHI
jgi:hypothetical protein